MYISITRERGNFLLQLVDVHVVYISILKNLLSYLIFWKLLVVCAMIWRVCFLHSYTHTHTNTHYRCVNRCMLSQLRAGCHGSGWRWSQSWAECSHLLLMSGPMEWPSGRLPLLVRCMVLIDQPHVCITSGTPHLNTMSQHKDEKRQGNTINALT